MNAETIAKVQSFGFDVYMRKETDTWLLFTDGKRIGYLQYNPSEGFSLSTVHVPNKTSGTGFQIERHVGDFDKAALERCFACAPHWAGGDVKSVVKYKDIAAYLNENSFNREYKLAEKKA